MKAKFDFSAFRMAIASAQKSPAGPRTREELDPYIMEHIVEPMEAGKDVRLHDVDYSKFTREDLKAALRVLCDPHKEKRMQRWVLRPLEEITVQPSQRPMFI